MKLAFVYAGQGSQRAGMGKDIYDTFPAARKLYDSLSVDFDLKNLSFTGGELLDRTSYTQPCMAAYAAAVTKVLADNGLRPDYAAGLSLGEYSALHCADVFDAQSLVSLVRFRGQAMEAAAEGIDAAMIAVLNFDRNALEACCKEASDHGVVCIANYNCPTQLVLGGERAAVEKAAALAKEKGAKRCIPLNTAGPFHTPLLKAAGEALQEKFKSVPFYDMTLPVIFNTTARPLSNGETIPTLLTKQVQSPVLFEDTILYLETQGVDTIVEIGPGKVLSGLIRKTVPDIKTYVIDTADDLASVIGTLKGAI